MPEIPTDQDLIAGCLDGQKSSWDIFVDRFSRLIYWSIQKTLETSSYKVRSDLVGDIYQECFTRLLERRELKTLRSVDSIRKFLTITASHLTMDKIRSIERVEKRAVSDISVIEASDGLTRDPAFHAISNEQAILISKALEALSPKQRLCVEWHYIDGKTHREISDVLGIPLDTVSAIVRRAKDKVKRIFLENNK